MHIFKRIFEIFGVNKTARVVLKIHSYEHKERIKHGYPTTKPTDGPVGLCIKGKYAGRERCLGECDSEQCVYHSWSLKPSLHGLFPFFLFFLPFFSSLFCFFLPPFLFSFFWKSEKNDNFLTTNFFNVKYRIKSKSNHFFKRQ